MKYMYNVKVFLFNDDGQGNWTRETTQTLGEWLAWVTNHYEGAEVISITETGDRLTAIVRTVARADEDDEDDEPDEDAVFIAR